MILLLVFCLLNSVIKTLFYLNEHALFWHSESKTNCELMRGMGLVTKLLTVLRDPQLSLSTTNTIASVICELLTGAPDPHGLLRYCCLHALLVKDHLSLIPTEKEGNWFLMPSQPWQKIYRPVNHDRYIRANQQGNAVLKERVVFGERLVYMENKSSHLLHLDRL